MRANQAPSPLVPAPLSAREALQGSEPLERLLQRVQSSRHRLRVIRAALPADLGEQVETGSLDAQHWTLLAANASVAAKLRQWVPRLDDALRAEGLEVIPIRIRVQRW